MAHEYPLHFCAKHLFFELDGSLWLVDTGSPMSFGAPDGVSIADRRFQVTPAFHGLNATSLSASVGVDCAGLLGADVLNEFDFLLDIGAGRATVAAGQLELEGTPVAMEQIMGLPVVTVRIGDASRRMIFDTGAQLSYLDSADGLDQWPSAGQAHDFYPGFGEFDTDTWHVPMIVAGARRTIRCGVLPALLSTALSLFGTDGILGNELLEGRTVVYAPRRGAMTLAGG
jgi:hypothetical protein